MVVEPDGDPVVDVLVVAVALVEVRREEVTLVWPFVDLAVEQLASSPIHTTPVSRH
ncbi:MAG: hypothetical protein ACYDEP_01265 [Acidimicrobiales bacterium]